MAKDYAKSKHRRSNPSTYSSGHSSLLPGWVWFLMGVLFGILIAILGYLRLGEKSPMLPEIAAIPQEASTPQKSTTPARPRFDFYTLLPEMEKESQPIETRKEKPAPKTVEKPKVETPKPTTVASGNNYFIQVGSFRKNEDADSLKAELTLGGFSVDVKSVIFDGQTWYRVMVGPYQQKEAAVQTQQHLSKLDYKTIIVQSN